MCDNSLDDFEQFDCILYHRKTRKTENCNHATIRMRMWYRRKWGDLKGPINLKHAVYMTVFNYNFVTIRHL